MDPLKSGFQAQQALYSLADGGLFGVGLGQGRAKWSYLPNAHNDFIFAIIGEELGFVGALAVLGLFATLAYTGFRIAARNTDPWLKLVVSTSTAWLVAQAAINIGYVVGLLPVTGLQLPLISSGGTSLVVTMFVFGIMTNAARHEPEAIAALRQQGQGRLARALRLPPPQPFRSAAGPGRAGAGAAERRSMTVSVVVAGGGSAGHIEPALALADAVRRHRPDAIITALGTERGLDRTLIPARGYAAGADPAGAAAPAAQRRPAAAARPGAQRGAPGPRGAVRRRRRRGRRVRRVRRAAGLPGRPRAGPDRGARGQRPGRAGQQGGRPARRPGWSRRCRAAGCPARRCSASRCAAR